MKYIAYTKNNSVILEILLNTQIVVDFEHIILGNLPTEPIETWYIENNEIKIDQAKVVQIKRQQMTALTKRQFNLVMYDNGLLTQVKELLSQDERTQIEFESTDTITRLHPTVIQLAKDLGLTEERVDELWAEALTIN